MNKIKVNGSLEYLVDELKGTILKIDGEDLVFDELFFSGDTATFICKHKVYNLQLLDFKQEEKTFVVKVNQNVYSLSLQDKYDQLLEKMGVAIADTNAIKILKAPMPGLVLDVLVREGQLLAKGDNLVVLEAMKMENIIKSPADLQVKRIHIAKGDKLEKNTLMIEFV